MFKIKKFKSYGKNFKKKFLIKQKGFILLMVMLLISSISLLVIGVFYKVYTSRRLASTMLNVHEKEKLLLNAISLVKNFLAGKDQIKNKNSNNAENEDNLSPDKKTEDSEENINKKFKGFLEIFWRNSYQWKFLDFKEESSGAEGTVKFFLMAESGKIPILSLIKAHYSIEEKAQDLQNNEDSKNKKNNFDQNEKNENTEKQGGEESKNPDDGKNNEDNKKKDIFNHKIYLFWEKFFEKSFENNSLLKKYTKENGSDQKNGKAILKNWLSNYIKADNKIYPPSLWFFFRKEAGKNNFYRSYFKNKDEVCLSELFTINSEKFSPYFISPEFLKIISDGKFELTVESREKILKIFSENKDSENKKEGQNKELNFYNIENYWNDVYKKNLNIAYPKEFFDELLKNNLLDYNYFPETYSAIICVESKFGDLTAIVLFEKITSSGKNDKEYLVKQIFFL